MFYDLNVPWTDNTRELQRTVAFLDECKLRPALVTLASTQSSRKSRLNSLTQRSRIRCGRSHPHILREAARRPCEQSLPTTRISITSSLLLIYFVFLVPSIGSNTPPDISRPASAPFSNAIALTHITAMQHIPHRRRHKPPHPSIAAALRHNRGPSHR
jgi:hypothetical protein